MKYKFFIVPFIASLVIACIFLAAQIPTAKVNPQHLPIAFVNEDSGELSKAMADKFRENAPDAIALIEYDTVEAMLEGMNERETYGGFVIPASFSQQIAAMQQPNSTQATVKLYVNEGLNPTVAQTAETMLQSIVAQLSKTVSEQTVAQLSVATEQMQQQPGIPAQLVPMLSPVQPEKIAVLANPVGSETIRINEAGALASVPMGLFTAVWLTSLVGALMFYMEGQSKEPRTANARRSVLVGQVLLPIPYSFFVGYAITWIATWILGYEFASFHDVALTLSIALLGFTYLISACLAVIKIVAVPLFAILMFFGLPLLQMAPEMLPSFYADYVLPWLPMRFLVDALKDVLFFGQPVLNAYTIVLVWIAVVSAIIVLVVNVMKLKKEAV